MGSTPGEAYGVVANGELCFCLAAPSPDSEGCCANCKAEYGFTGGDVSVGMKGLYIMGWRKGDVGL